MGNFVSTHYPVHGAENNAVSHRDVFREVLRGICVAQERFTTIPLVPVDSSLMYPDVVSTGEYLPAISPLSHGHLVNYAGWYCNFDWHCILTLRFCCFHRRILHIPLCQAMVSPNMAQSF